MEDPNAASKADRAPTPTPRKSLTIKQRRSLPDAKHFSDVLASELACIDGIRKNKERRYGTGYHQAGTGPNDSPPLAALALSGGGIRSSAFALGILQSFANEGLLKRFDYMSTVSGGGYIGSALTWFLSDVWQEPGRPRLGTGECDHPLGRRGVGAKTGSENDRIDHIRGFGNYLRPTPKLWAGSAVALVIQNMIYVALLWFFPLVLAFLLLDQLAGLVVYHQFGFDLRFGDSLPYLVYGAGFLSLIALSKIIQLPSFAWRTLLGERPSGLTDYAGRLASQNVLGKFLVGIVACIILALVPRIPDPILQGLGPGVTIAGLIGTVSTVSGLVASRPLLKGVLLRLGIALLALGLLVLAILVPEWVANEIYDYTSCTNLPTARYYVFLGSLGLALLAFYASLRLGLNHIGLHRLYRDRLMETFLPDKPYNKPDPRKDPVPGLGVWRRADMADTTALAGMCDSESLGPLHLICANIILIGSENTVARNRGGESFLLSPLYSGCDRTGWRSTSKLFSDVQLQLSTAMAISGAALSPNTGPSGRGLTREALTSRLMMLFNLSLAYWMPNPRPKEEARPNPLCKWLISIANGHLPWHEFSDRPRFAYPGFAALVGITHREHSAYVELSDGGHFENLGLYEMVRRRVPLIVLSDAGMDGNFGFSDLANAIERVRVDFGVDIDFDREGFGLDCIQVAKDRLLCIAGVHTEVAARGWAIATIHYPKASPSQRQRGAEHGLAPASNAFDGVLVYMKPAIRAGLKADILAYRAENPDFPHDTTADQFFDETQFEAYRELGYETAGEFLKWLCNGNPPASLDVLLGADRHAP